MIYHRLTCRLPVVNLQYEEDDTEHRVISECGEIVVFDSGASGAFYRFENDGDYDGPPEDITGWKVECAAGHVLFLSDTEGNERFVPFSQTEFLTACADLVKWIEDN